MRKAKPAEIKGLLIRKTILEIGIAQRIIELEQAQYQEGKILLEQCEFWIRISNILDEKVVNIVIQYPHPETLPETQVVRAEHPIHPKPRYNKLIASFKQYQQLINLVPVQLRPQIAFDILLRKEQT